MREDRGAPILGVDVRERLSRHGHARITVTDKYCTPSWAIIDHIDEEAFHYDLAIYLNQLRRQSLDTPSFTLNRRYGIWGEAGLRYQQQSVR